MVMSAFRLIKVWGGERIDLLLLPDCRALLFRSVQWDSTVMAGE